MANNLPPLQITILKAKLYVQMGNMQQFQPEVNIVILYLESERASCKF